MIIDAHAHLGHADGKSGKFYHAAELLKEMKKGGVTYALVLADYGEGEGLGVKQLLEEIKGHKNLFTVPNWHKKFALEELEEIADFMRVGLVRGFKVYPGYDQVWPTDKRLDAIYDLCEKYDYPVIFHTGLFYPSKSALLKYSHPLPIDKLALKRPKLKIIIAHSGYPWAREAAAVVHKNDNVYSDISGFLEFEKFDKGKKKHFTQIMMEMRGIAGTLNKFLFGTDYPLASHKDYVKFVKQLPITKEEKDFIFFKNAKNLFKI